MKPLLFLLSLLLSIAGAKASSIIFPLYIYPDTDCAAWTRIFSAIHNFPQLTFYVVINPNSGPGAVGTQPDSNYQACAARMNTFANVITMGYIFTRNGGRPVSDVNSDIGTYAGWNASYRPHGIFFDEVNAPESDIPIYTSYVNTVRSELGSNAFVTLNPGTTPPAGFFTAGANLIVTIEFFYSDFDVSDLVISPSSPASQQAVLLHNAPATTPSSVVQDLSRRGILALYITSSPQAVAYEQVPPDWENFVREVASS